MKGLKSLIIAVMLSVVVMATAGTFAPARDTSDGKTGTSSPQARPDDDASRRYDYFFLEAITQKEAGNSAAAFDLLRHCIEIDSCAAEAYYYLARYYTQLRDKATALRLFKKAADLNPENPTYQETLAQSYVNSGLFEEAIETFEKVVAADKNRDDVLDMLTQLYEQQQDYDNAIRTIERIEEIEGKSERLSYAKSDIYTQQGKKEEAIAEIKRLADEYPYDLNYRGMYGDMLLINGEEDKAMDVFRGILEEEPDNSRVQLSMRAYYKQQRDTAAADSMTMAILLNKNTTPEGRALLIRQEVAESENGDKDSTKILRYFDSMAENTPPDAEIGMLHASYMILKNMPREKIKPVLERVLEIAPDNSAARLQLVGYALEDDDKDRVIELCKAAREYNPDNIAFYYYQGLTSYQKDDLDGALDALQNGVGTINDETDPDLASSYYSALADILHQKGFKEEAYAAYDSCLQWKGDNAYALNNYAYYLCTEGGDLDKAEQMAHKAITEEPENANSLDTYAWILFLRERYAEAKIYIEQALRNDSDSSAVILEHAGDIYVKCGETDKAVEMWQAALLKEPENKILIRKIKRKRYLKE